MTQFRKGMVMDMESDRISLSALCRDICDCMGIDAPSVAEPSGGRLKSLAGDRKCERVVMYNPDAQAEWLVKKYPEIFEPVTSRCHLAYKFATVMPSVTPVCFATMYTGAMPEVHGIRKYEKPVLETDTIFDTLVRAGKKAAIVATKGSSMSIIFGGRDIDYYIIPADADADEKAVKKGIELIKEDKYDFLVIYNGNYDSMMHVTYPESEYAMHWLRHHADAFARIYSAVSETSKRSGRTALVGYATDHGVHTNENGRGTHGADIPEDIEITHFYDVI